MRKCDSCGCVVNDKNLVQVITHTLIRMVCKSAAKCAKQRDMRIKQETAARQSENDLRELEYWDENFNPSRRALEGHARFLKR